MIPPGEASAMIDREAGREAVPARDGSSGCGSFVEPVFAILADAARHGRPAPSHIRLAKAIGCRPGQVRYALDRLLELGRIRRYGAKNRPRFEISGLGISTAEGGCPAAPPARRPGRQWTVKRDLTMPQRQVLAAALALIGATGFASTAAVARDLAITRNAARDRLVRIARFGLLTHRPDGRFGPPPQPPPPDETRVEIRDGVRVTICPPRLAQGALIFRPMLGRGPGGIRR